MPTPDEIDSGWGRIGDLAVSPKSPMPLDLPRGEWDVWLVVEEVPQPRSLEVFVNYSPFSLRPEPNSTWQCAAVDRFWGQLAAWWPESYLAEGDSLTCVTRAEHFIREVEEFFRSVGPGMPGRARD